MGSAVAETGLELQLCSMRTVGGGLVKEAEASSLGLGIESGRERGKAARLEESIKNLEEEKRKIEAFKRELPLCMGLICGVIQELKREIDQCRDDNFRHLFEEFIMPVDGKVDRDRVKVESDSEDKMDWLSSVQLWSNGHHQDSNEDDDNYDKTINKEKNANLHLRERKENLFCECKGRSVGGASLPLEHQSSYNEEDTTAAQLPDLSQRSPALTPSLAGSFAEDHRFGGRKDVREASEPSPVTLSAHFSLQSQQQSPRKARRCWSQELHRRFVLAIQQLGGAQAATPKQIRELMKVDGLTNDEVKSHLQKYRMHNRRVHNASARASQEAVAGLWVPDDQYTSSSQQSVSLSLYGSPLSPLQLASSLRALASDSSEEEGKSESYSCK